MANRNKFHFMLILLMIGGALAPPLSLAGNYLLFASSMEDTHGYVYQMDGAGNLKLRVEPKVPYDCCRIGVSPDGRTVVYSSYTTPTLTLFHIGQDCSLTSPLAVNGLAKWSGWSPVAFHPSLPLFYVQNSYVTSIYRYDWAASTVKPIVNNMAISRAALNLGYSTYCNRLIFPNSITLGRIDALGTAPLREDGALSAPGPPLQLPDDADLGFAVSPDGRWVAYASLLGLHLVSVGQDGTLNMTDTFDFGPDYHIGGQSHLGFSPDSRYIYLLSDNIDFLVCFEVDQQAGHLVEHSLLSVTDVPVTMDCLNAFALTPDGRYAAICTAHPIRWREGYNMIHLIQLDGNGGMAYLDGKQMDVPQYLNAMAFAPLPDTAAGPQWALYE